ncbi:alcohol acetyltransferase [Mycena albidolilacea]|uniref:Alcohol acetyltransferase n=1 Tax=Mycena albidolilacea TaxID=1033008 RepID=A0AAD6Z5G2_9AGAR|nr:alcohol acetyltransferase [Mycena albidolilacea]
MWADMAADTRIRRTGLLERYHATRNFLGLDSCVAASAKYSTEDRRPLTKDILFPALRQVIKTHPPLCVGLANESSSTAAFTRLHTIDLSRIVQFRDNDSLRDALESQLAEGFDTDADLPLWRIQVLGDNTVIFAIYHIIGDGLSTIAFHASLLRALRDVPAGDASPLVQTPNTILLSPPIEDVTSVRPSLSTIFDEVYRLFAPKYLSSDRKAWSGNPVPMGVNGSLRTNVRLMSFPAHEVTAFCTMCQTHRTTVTAAFYVLTVATLSRMLAGDPRYDAISSTVAISLRGAAGIPKDAICDYVSAHRTYPPADPRFSWPAAAHHAAKLRTQKSKARENIGMLRFLLGQYVPFFRSHLGRKRASGFVLSNLGRFDASAVEGTWNIVNTVFAQCDVVVGAAFKMNVVCDPTGALNIALTWGEHSIESDFVESFLSRFQDAFRGLLV